MTNVFVPWYIGSMFWLMGCITFLIPEPFGTLAFFPLMMMSLYFNLFYGLLIKEVRS